MSTPAPAATTPEMNCRLLSLMCPIALPQYFLAFIRVADAPITELSVRRRRVATLGPAGVDSGGRDLPLWRGSRGKPDSADARELDAGRGHVDAEGEAQQVEL